MSNEKWFARIARANSEASLADIRNEALAAREWDVLLNRACLERLDKLKRPFGVAPDREARIRADERLKVLREVRKVASRIRHEHQAVDPYTAGSSGPEIVSYLGGLIRQQREMMEQPTRGTDPE